jgi:hypothetical protein
LKKGFRISGTLFVWRKAVWLICFAEFRLRLCEATSSLDLADLKALHRHLRGAHGLINPPGSHSTSIVIYCLVDAAENPVI